MWVIRTGFVSTEGELLLPLIHRRVVAQRFPSVELPWPTDAVTVADHLVPVGDPANSATEGKYHSKHAGGDAYGFEDDA